MKLEEFLIAQEKNNGRNRTINIKEDLHNYYKKVASNYNVSMSTIISNILWHWRNEFDQEVKEDMIDRIKNS